MFYVYGIALLIVVTLAAWIWYKMIRRRLEHGRLDLGLAVDILHYPRLVTMIRVRSAMVWLTNYWIEQFELNDGSFNLPRHLQQNNFDWVKAESKLSAWMERKEYAVYCHTMLSYWALALGDLEEGEAQFALIPQPFYEAGPLRSHLDRARQRLATAK